MSGGLVGGGKDACGLDYQFYAKFAPGDIQWVEMRINGNGSLVNRDLAVEVYLTKRMHMARFANARSVRNALDRARLRQANRLFIKGGRISKVDLMTIEAEDILASRVFDEDLPEEELGRDVARGDGVSGGGKKE